MGEIIGFVCSKCNYEKSYFLGQRDFQNPLKKNFMSA